jgi:two-component system, LytTR family, response regulator
MSIKLVKMPEQRVIRVCVIDDEPIACRKIQSLLKDYPEIEIVQVCKNGEEASESIRRLLPDLIFLDVQMPGLDGFEVLESLKGLNSLPYVIFVTAYDRYAIRAFEVHALDYLLKPFDKKRFADALNHAKDQILQHRGGIHNRDLFALLNEIKAQPRVMERLVVNNRILKAEEIDWIEAQGKYAMIHAKQDSHLVREGMSNFENELDPRKFVRIHKSTIVNVDRIERIQPLFHGEYRVILRNGTVLTASRRYRRKLDELLGRRL